MGLLQLAAMALAPCLAIIIFVYWKDNFEKEPLTLLASSFFLGIVSAAPALMLSYSIDNFFIQFNLSYPVDKIVLAFLVAGVGEELSKFIFLYSFPYRSRFFDEPYDGITYSVMISMGFATLENLLYMLSHGSNVIYLRAFTAVPAHASFAVIMGYFVGLAKFKRNNPLYLFAGLFFAILLHGFYDLFLFLDQHEFMAIGAFISLILGVYLSLKAIRLHNSLPSMKGSLSTDSSLD